MKLKAESLQDLRSGILETATLLNEGVITVEDIVAKWLKTVDVLQEYVEREELIEERLGVYRNEIFALQRQLDGRPIDD